MAEMARERRAKASISPADIKRIRQRLGLTPAQAAAKIGLSRRAWAYYESGDRAPSASMTLLIRLLDSGKIK